MSWFSTSHFHFELPGETWREETMNVYRPDADERTAFIIARMPADEEGVDVKRVVDAVELRDHEEREILHDEPGDLGPYDAQDVAMIARSGGIGVYLRFIRVDLKTHNLMLQWAGPVADREAVEDRVQRTLATLRFR